MAAVKLQDILLGLNYLLGDSAIPASGTSNQVYFVNRTIEKIWDMEDFEWAQLPAVTLQMSSQSSSLSSLTNFDGRLIDVREVVAGTGLDHVYRPIDTALVLDADTSDYYYSVDGNQEDGFTITINQTTSPLLTIIPKAAPDVLVNDTDITRVPRSMPVAQGAFEFMQRTRNPFGTLQEFEENFTIAVSDLIRTNTRRKPSRQFYTPSEARNKPIGKPRNG